MAAARIAHVDDHETVRLGFASMLLGEPDLHLVLSTTSVSDILPRAKDFDLVSDHVEIVVPTLR